MRLPFPALLILEDQALRVGSTPLAIGTPCDWVIFNQNLRKGWFIRQTSTSNIFHAKTRRKRRRRTGIAIGETAFFVLRPLGSRYYLRNFLVTHLTASSSFHLSVIGSSHFPGLHAVHCKLLARSSVSKQHSTCLPEAPQNLQSRPYPAIILRGFAASRANCPGTHWPEDPKGLRVLNESPLAYTPFGLSGRLYGKPSVISVIFTLPGPQFPFQST